MTRLSSSLPSRAAGRYGLRASRRAVSPARFSSLNAATPGLSHWPTRLKLDGCGEDVGLPQAGGRRLEVVHPVRTTGTREELSDGSQTWPAGHRADQRASSRLGKVPSALTRAGIAASTTSRHGDEDSLISYLFVLIGEARRQATRTGLRALITLVSTPPRLSARNSKH
jgi:hypothetical protein